MLLLSRNVLDILRNNSRLEALYSMVAARACQVRHAAPAAAAVHMTWHVVACALPMQGT